MCLAGDRPQGTRRDPAQVTGFRQEATISAIVQHREHAMHRRSILWGALSALGSTLGAALATSRANAAPQARPQEKLKVVYHLGDLDKVSFVLGNIQNHFDGVGGPDHVTIALVVHGPALRAFHLASTNPDMTRRVGQFSKAGLELAACGN